MKQGEALSTLMPSFFIQFSYSELMEAAPNIDSSMKISGHGYLDFYEVVLRGTHMTIKMHEALSNFQQEIRWFVFYVFI